MANSSYSTNLLSADFTANDAIAKFAVGTRADGNGGSEWIYCVASGAIASQGQVVTLTPTTWAAALLGTANDARGNLVGVANGAITDAQYGWVQVRGPCVVQVAASCAANVLLNTTATAGQIDDDATTGAYTITGIFLTTARGGTAGTAAGILNFPQEGVVL